MKNSKIIGAVSLLAVILISWLSINQISTPTPALPGYAQDSYSAYRAIEHLKVIAKEPHTGGTVAHKKVRNYIYDVCKKNGLDVKVHNDTGLRSFGSTIVAGSVFNILAKLPGFNSSKAVLVMAHYDSQPNTPGAADDGSGVASMLETIELLSKKNLKNDIYFLFTDLEEVGLLGAESFVNSNEELKDIGIILNYEARGNSGASFTFETSSDNGWVVRQFAKATEKPLANSLAYEIYKLMPNDSDFTMFRDSGISGLNSAFIDGYTYYHSAADTHQNIDLGSLQHQGDLMSQMVNHFGSIDLTNTKDEDVIFFSLFNWVVIYPSSFDWPLILLTLIAFFVVVIIGLKKKELKVMGIAKGSLSYLISILLTMLLVFGLNSLIIALNPHYSNFYSNNFYNATSYLWVFIGASLLSFSLINAFVFKKTSSKSMLLGGLLIQVIMIIVIKNIVPTGAFILYIPMLPSLILALYEFTKSNLSPLIKPTIQIILPLLLWVPFIYFLFVVFSLSLPYASAFFIILLYPYLQDLSIKLEALSKSLLGWIGLIFILGGFIYAQSSSDYSKEQPLQTQLAYALNLDKNEAFWISRQKNKDEFISKYISTEEKQLLNEIYPESNRPYWKNNAPLNNVSPAKIITQKDTLINGIRRLELEVIPGNDVTRLGMLLPNDAFYSQVGERVVDDENSTDLFYYAPSTEGCKVVIITNNNNPISITLVESKLGITQDLLKFPLPDDFIFGTGSLSNNMLIKRTLIL